MSQIVEKRTSGALRLKAMLGAFLVVAGLLFTGLLWWSYVRAQETRHWPTTDGLVVLSEVISEKPTINSPVHHRAVVRYNYEFGGRKYTGNHVKRVEGGSVHRDKADEIVERYPVGKRVTCYVNPNQPDFAILEHATKAGLYTMWFPLLFVVGGGGMVLSAFRSGKNRGKA